MKNITTRSIISLIKNRTISQCFASLYPHVRYVKSSSGFKILRKLFFVIRLVYINCSSCFSDCDCTDYLMSSTSTSSSNDILVYSESENISKAISVQGLMVYGCVLSVSVLTGLLSVLRICCVSSSGPITHRIAKSGVIKLYINTFLVALSSHDTAESAYIELYDP